MYLSSNFAKSCRIDPYDLVYWKGKRYTLTFCHLREEIRSF
ncbi:WYL domain-containing protein [Bacillus wiedmannii]